MKKTRTSIFAGAALATALVIPAAGRADDRNNHAAATADPVFINFGSTHPQPTPAQLSHVLDPAELTVVKGQLVTFIVNGGGHGISVYPVSKDTTRELIENQLCVHGPVALPAGGSFIGCVDTTFANGEHAIVDGKGDVVIDTDSNPPVAHGMPGRVYDPANILVAVPGTPGAGGFLTGSAFNATTNVVTPGNQAGYRFTREGRYLVICMNRSHSLNDWMFGFVNVIGDDGRSQ